MGAFNHELLYIAYVDDATFLKKDMSFFEFLNIFHKFSFVYGLKPYTAKCKLFNIDALKSVNVVRCGIKYLSLMK